MAPISNESLLGAGALSGFILAQVYRIFEPTLPGFFLNQSLLFTACGFLLHRQNVPLLEIALATGAFATVHILTMSTSIILYRLFFHPLRKFPGPFWSKISKWQGVTWSFSGHLHEWLPSLHDKYGDIVRIGPNELSFSNAKAVKYIHGPQGARLTKGPYYDAGLSKKMGNSMPGTRDWEDHRVRRRQWDHGFAQKSLKSYEGRILNIIQEMCDNMNKHVNETIQMDQWFDYFAFDAMGDLAFNKSFHMLSGGDRVFVEMTRRGVQAFHIMGGVPWMTPIAKLMPMPEVVRKQALAFRDLGKALYKQRIVQGTEPNDLYSHLLAKGKGDHQTPANDLEADATTIVIAGSETTSICATFLFYFLTTYPSVYTKLRAELDSAWDGVSPLEGSTIAPEVCPYLQGCISEALRIMPPGPNGMQRRTGKEGHVVDGVYIPPFTQVQSNTMSLHRDPRNFTNPMDFIPERWSEKTRDPTWNHEPQAYLPFTGGTYSCAGRALALLELRFLCAKLLRQFEFSKAPTFSDEKFFGDLVSFQSLVKAPLLLTLKTREKS